MPPRRALHLPPGSFLALALAAACTAPPPAGTPPPASTAAPTAARPAPLLPPPLPPLEDEAGIAGAPRDETSFEYDVEPDYVAPPLLDGIPPIAPRIRSGLQPFLETRRAKLSAFARESGMIVLTRLAETTHAHQVAVPLGMRRQLTFGTEPVEQVSFGPTTTRSLVYRADLGGREDYQIFQLDLTSRRLQLLTDGKSRHGPFRWSAGGKLAFTGNERNGTDMDLYLRAPDDEEPRRIAELSGQWVVLGWSRDARKLLVRHFAAADRSMVAVVDAESGETNYLAPLEKGLRVGSALFAGDKVLVIANRDRDTKGIFEVDPAQATWRPLTSETPGEVEEMALASEGRTLAYVRNDDGYSQLLLLDLASGASQPLPGIEPGVISGLRFTKDALAFTLSTPTQPADAVIYHLKPQRLVRWTESEVGGLAPQRFVKPDLVRVTSFDGIAIPAFVYRPRGKGPFPVLLWMHGGPEEQFRPIFDPIIQYFAAVLGIAVVAPNVRGSDGYGARYLALDDGMRRHDAVADLGAILDWVESEPSLDETRVGIHGASYGGFMVLASLVAYPGRIRAGSDQVGMSSLVSFLENTRDYRRELRREEYGNESVPQVRAYLESISPLARAGEITSALLVAHGANDPRVPLSEAEQIVKAVRDNGREAWFFVAHGEGHSFRKRRNRDAFCRVMAQFFARHLLDEALVDHPSENGLAPGDRATSE